MGSPPEYVTQGQLEKVIEKLPTRWEVRSLILAAVVVTNVDIPTEVTAGAVGLAVAGGIFKAILFR